MFGKKKKKTVYNEVFGEMVHWTRWESTKKVNFTLWNKIYEIDIFAVGRTLNDEINKKQEDSYTKFKESILEYQKGIEAVIEEQYQLKDALVLAAKFTPTEIVFGRDGICGLFVDDNDEEYGPYDDYDIGLAVSIIPEIKYYTQDEYTGHLFRYIEE